jgi:hypothetical protein
MAGDMCSTVMPCTYGKVTCDCMNGTFFCN